MNSLMTLIRRWPLPAYFFLAYILTWVLVPLIVVSPMYGLPGLFVPALAGLIVSRVSGGREQAAKLLGRLMIWRVHFVWYLVALGLPAVLSLLVALLGRLFGADPVLQPAPLTPLALILFVLVVGEELGWRGYAQPELEKSFSPLVAAIILGVLWGFWHLPNFFIPTLPHHEIPLPAFVIWTIALSILAAWLLKQTRGSVLLATLLHGATNTLGFLTPNLDVATRWWLTAGVYGAAALLVVMIYGTQLDRSRSARTVDASLPA